MTLREINFSLSHFYITVYHRSISNTETTASLVILVSEWFAPFPVSLQSPQILKRNSIVGGTLNYEELSVQSANWPQVPGRWFHLFHRKTLNLYKVCMHPSPLSSSKKTKNKTKNGLPLHFPESPPLCHCLFIQWRSDSVCTRIPSYSVFQQFVGTGHFFGNTELQ